MLMWPQPASDLAPHRVCWECDTSLQLHSLQISYKLSTGTRIGSFTWHVNLCEVSSDEELKPIVFDWVGWLRYPCALEVWQKDCSVQTCQKKVKARLCDPASCEFSQPSLGRFCNWRRVAEQIKSTILSTYSSVNVIVGSMQINFDALDSSSGTSLDLCHMA